MVENGWDRFQVNCLAPFAKRISHASHIHWWARALISTRLLLQAWYDEKAWYPLGRHVGSTTYPGLQLTSWALYVVGNYFSEIELNDVCVLLPAGFGAVATWAVRRSNAYAMLYSIAHARVHFLYLHI